MPTWLPATLVPAMRRSPPRRLVPLPSSLDSSPPPSGRRPLGLTTPGSPQNPRSLTPLHHLLQRPRPALPRPRSSPPIRLLPPWLLLPSSRRAVPLGPLPRFPLLV